MKPIIAPSILAADFANLGRDVRMINESEADWIHIDVMDGRFVPNISFGFPVMEAIKRYSEKPLDVHLMIVEPERYISEFKKAGADILTVHIEASNHLHRTITAIKEAGMKAGVSLNPHTPVSTLEEILPFLDLVLIMSVNPGYGGQKFIESTYDKIKKVKQLKTATGSSAIIEVDGGVGIKNASDLIRAGAEALVAGSSVFNSDDPKATIAALKNIDINTISA